MPSVHRPRVAEYPRPDHVLFHFSDTHLIAGDDRLYGDVDTVSRLRRTLRRAEAGGVRPTAIVFTGDLADDGEVQAYHTLRELVEPFAERLDAPVIWVMGNHDSRAELRTGLLDEAASTQPLDGVHLFAGLRIITLDTTVPGEHHGEIGEDQLAWLSEQLLEPAPFGTILAMHHPPIPSVLDLATTVELRDQHRLAPILARSDVRSILSGHLHYSTAATFAGIPVSVASSTCYTQDLTVEQGGSRGRDGAQGFNYVHIFSDTVVHSVVPMDAGPSVGTTTTPEQARGTLDASGIVIDPAARIPYVRRRRIPAVAVAPQAPRIRVRTERHRPDDEPVC